MSTGLPPQTHLRIDFVIREVSPDGAVDADELRFIRFGEDVEKVHVRDFFDRVGHAMGLMFRPEGGHTVFLESVGPNKINVIKVVREVTQWGLKEAKDLVESPTGTPFLITKEYNDLKEVVRKFEEAGAKIGARNFRPEDSTPRSPLPVPREYHRLP